MEFEVDVSGEDILNKDYTICVANKDSFIKGFKFDEKILGVLSSKFSQENYKYKKSKNGRSAFKIRLYCLVIYYIFKNSGIKGDVSLKLCRDFTGKDQEIKENLKFFLENQLGLDIKERIFFGKLSIEANAHKYACLMRMDTKDKMSTYIRITQEEFERWLIKREK
jgi:hypothetical protein